MFKKIFLIFISVSAFVFFQLVSLYPAYFLNIHAEEFTDSKNNYRVDYLNINNKKVKFVFFDNKKECPLIIYYHGNNELVDHHVEYFSEFVKENCVRALLVEYNGYGSSDGFPSLKETTENTMYWLKLNELNNERLNVWGRSIGSAHAYNFLSKYPDKIDNIIIHAGFLTPLNFFTDNKNIINILENFMVVNYNVEDKISELTKNKNINLIIFHGTKDHMFSEQVPKHIATLFETHQIKSKVYLYEGGHNIIPSNMYDIVGKLVNE